MSAVDDQALAWMAMQSAGPLSDADRSRFEGWYAANPRHQGAYLRAQAIWHTLDKASIQPNLRPAAGPSQAESVAAPLKRAPVTRRNFMIGGALAAGVAAAAAVTATMNERVVLKTATGELRKVPLADRSVANLNSGSHVEVRMSRKLRQVVLHKGEAWFEVAKNPDRPFVVEAGDVRVRAVGTAFSVRRRDDGADVLVSEGVVEVWSHNDSTFARRVTAGEEAFVREDGGVTKVSADLAAIDRKLAWRDGNIVLDEQTLADAVAEFNRYNALKLVIGDPALSSRRFVGQYRIDQPEAFAEAVRSLLDVQTAAKPGMIVIGVSPATARSNAAG